MSGWFISNAMMVCFGLKPLSPVDTSRPRKEPSFSVTTPVLKEVNFAGATFESTFFLSYFRSLPLGTSHSFYLFLG